MCFYPSCCKISDEGLCTIAFHVRYIEGMHESAVWSTFQDGTYEDPDFIINLQNQPDYANLQVINTENQLGWGDKSEIFYTSEAFYPIDPEAMAVITLSI